MKGCPPPSELTHPSQHIGTFSFVRKLKLYSLSQFQLQNTVLSPPVTVVFIRPSDLIHLRAENLYPFTSFSLFPSSPSPWKPPSYFLSMGSTLPEVPHMGCHGVFVLPCLTDFTEHNVLLVRSCCCEWQGFLLF